MARTPKIPSGLESDAFVVNGKSVPAGTQREIDLPVARLPSGTWMSLPVIVMHGARPGPGVWISAAIHGDELNGVDWDKGCFLGQELTARTHYRGLVKKRLMPVEIDGPLPAPGTLVMLGEKEAGEMRSGADHVGLALLRLEAVERAAAEDLAFTVGDARLAPKKPAWATF